MGFASRLRMGLATMFGGTQYVKVGGTSFNVHRIKEAASPNYGRGFSQPVWSPEISTVGAYSREGYTSRTFDLPVIPFKQQVTALEQDEDVQLAVNHLASKITGGEHYWKSENEAFVDYMNDFTHAMDFDWFDTILVKELLWYGNSCWKPRDGVANIHDQDDLMHIPISSFVRIWWDRQRRPYKLEFRGSEYQGYHNPEDILHFKWNPVDASAFGLGFGTAMLSTRPFTEIIAGGETRDKVLPTLLDRKYSTQMTMHLTERRYIPRNVYEMQGSSQTERDAFAAQLGDLETGEDFTVGNKIVPHELGSVQRAFDPTMFTNLTMGQILKALQDFRGKQGDESSHQFANAKTSAVLDEIGLASFPLAVTRQLHRYLFEPWYAGNPMYDPAYGGGMVAYPWDEAKPELNFGRVEKQDIPIEHQIKLIELFMSSGLGTDPAILGKMFEDAGLALPIDYTKQLQQEYNPDPTQVVPPDMQQDPMQQDPSYSFDNNYMGSPPMDNPNYDSMMQDVRGTGGATEPIESMDATWQQPDPSNYVQPSDPRLTFTTVPKIIGLKGKVGKMSGKKQLALINGVLFNTAADNG